MPLRTKSADDCLAALERLAPLQTRAVQALKLCSLGRLLRIKKEYLARLDACAPRGDEGTLARLGELFSTERADILAAQAKLRKICGTLNTLQNRTRLSKSYLA